jgi:hypothetical protein
LARRELHPTYIGRFERDGGRSERGDDTITRRDAKIDDLEQAIPELASAAVTQAYYASLAAGNDVMVVANGAIYEVSPYGRRTYVKAVEPSIPVELGARRNFR